MGKWQDEELGSEPSEFTSEEEYTFRWETEFANDKWASEDLSEVYKTHDKWGRRYDIDEDDYYN